MHCSAMSGSGSGFLEVCCFHMPVCRTVLDCTSCSGEPGARVRGGPSCADAEPCTIGGATAMSLGGAKTPAARALLSVLRGFLQGETLVMVRLCCGKARSRHIVKGMIGCYKKVESLETSP